MQPKDRIFTRSLDLLWESSAKQTVLNVIVLIFRSLLPVLIIFLIRYYIDNVIGSPSPAVTSFTSAMVWIIAVIAVAILADDLLSALGYYTSKKQAFLLERKILTQIHRRSASLGLRFFEDPSYHDMLSRAASDTSWRPAGIISDLMFFLRGIFSFIAMAVILWKFSPAVIAVIPLAFIPVFLIRRQNSARLYEVKKSSTPLLRQASYFSWLLTGERPAREVKLFNLSSLFERLFTKNFSESKEEGLKVIRKNALMELSSALVKMLSFAGVIIYATKSLIDSVITTGEMAMYLIAFRQAMVYMRDSVSGISGLNESRLFIKDLFLFLDLKSEISSGDKTLPVTQFDGLEVRDITFTYPGSVVPAISKINLSLKKGERLAIVGPNGSGKTTLVKLLCRLYDPESGEIKLNGTDVREFEIENYRRHYSVVFQDFMLYYLTAAENISIGDTSSEADEERIKEAAKKAGAAEFLEHLPGGYQTMLGHHTEGGRELSWGEWQKLAIARALYREAPVIIFDEPSSSLDADSEYEVFSKLEEITHGRTSILISHRLANVANADRIIVLKDGYVEESGTHEELMSVKGQYFTMFMRQKTMYK